MKKITVFFLFIILVSCNTTRYRSLQSQLIKNIDSRDFYSAKKTVNDKDFYNEDKSSFLNKIEKGTIYYLNGDYYQALKYSDEAKEISDNLYSISIINNTISLVDVNFGNYYGERYERSMLRFYQSLMHYKLYKSGKYESYTYKDNNGNVINIPEKVLTYNEKLMHLQSAKSIILEWDTLMSTYKEETIGKSSFKVDIMAKLWGAYIHEQINTLEDKQIALQLYKDAKDVLLKNYNVYPTFNKKYDKFENNFSKLHKMNIDYVKDNFIVSTEYSKDLINYINEQIKRLNKNNKNNLTILLKNSFISEKKTKTIKFKIPLNLLLFQDNPSIVAFSLALLNLKTGDVPLIEFEVPYIDKKNTNNKFLLKLNNNKSLIEKTIPLVSPNSEIAYKELKDKYNVLYTKIGTITSAKYATAIITAYNIYKQGGENPLSLLAARITFKSAEKVIKNTTKADLRYWSTLPNDIRMFGLNVENGKYNVEIYSIDDKSKKLIYKDVVDINDSNKNYFIDLNL